MQLHIQAITFEVWMSNYILLLYVNVIMGIPYGGYTVSSVCLCIFSLNMISYKQTWYFDMHGVLRVLISRRLCINPYKHHFH